LAQFPLIKQNFRAIVPLLIVSQHIRAEIQSSSNVRKDVLPISSSKDEKENQYKLPSGDAAQSDMNELGSTIAGDFSVETIKTSKCKRSNDSTSLSNSKLFDSQHTLDDGSSKMEIGS
jgi:hypothetical protein